jgi:hypothetical protein
MQEEDELCFEKAQVILGDLKMSLNCREIAG